MVPLVTFLMSNMKCELCSSIKDIAISEIIPSECLVLSSIALGMSVANYGLGVKLQSLLP